MSSGNRRMLSVCRTRPEHGAAKYSSRWRAVFQANVPTRPSSEMPSASSTPASLRVRSAHSPYVVRSIPPGWDVATLFSGNSRSARWNTCVSVSGYDDIKPCIAALLLLGRRSVPVILLVRACLDRATGHTEDSRAGRRSPGQDASPRRPRSSLIVLAGCGEAVPDAGAPADDEPAARARRWTRRRRRPAPTSACWPRSAPRRRGCAPRSHARGARRRSRRRCASPG